MQLVSQLPDNPATAMRIVDHMKALLSYASGKTDDACMEPESAVGE